MGGLLFGGLEEIRTPDPHNANVVRSQLRYEPVYIRIIVLPSKVVKHFDYFLFKKSMVY